jgi:hypothetical protein
LALVLRAGRDEVLENSTRLAVRQVFPDDPAWRRPSAAREVRRQSFGSDWQDKLAALRSQQQQPAKQYDVRVAEGVPQYVKFVNW